MSAIDNKVQSVEKKYLLQINCHTNNGNNN